MHRLRVGMAQINTTVGDFAGNTEKILPAVEADKSIEQIVDMGCDEAAVRQAAQLVDRSEYKRRQAPPGIKITPRAFGRDRRLPITNRFKEW